MPKQISLAAYNLQIFRTSGGRRLPIDRFDGTHDLFDCIYKCLSEMRRTWLYDEESMVVLQVDTLFQDKHNYMLYGLIQRGEDGIESTLINKKRNSVSYLRTPDDAEMRPFYFLISFRPGAKRAIVLLQRTGASGFTTEFGNSLDRFFGEEHDGYYLNMHHLMPREMIRRFLEEGRVREIVYTKFTTGDIANLVPDGYREEKDSMKLVFQAGRGESFRLPGFTDEILDGKAYTDIVELRDNGIKQVQATVRFGKSDKTIDFTDLNKIRAYFNITNEIKFNGGNPDFDSIHRRAVELLDEIYPMVDANQMLDDE